MKRLKVAILSLVALFGIGLTFVPAHVSAIDIYEACGTSTSPVCKAKSDSLSPLVTVIVNTLLFVVGAVSVIMIIVGGIRYTTSGGNEKAVKGAKDTILYAVIGLIIAFLAFAIVNWVIKLL